ncbi:lipase/acyltransferase domain-containing protein [Oleiagrimonas soli]|uniref:Uncharacterized protein n=1 Tax=Oleiagrimonas soli TaxID=1543381 RepID=A0A099CZN2_9GAMM|nr:hypothetical protein [Oleiagrimonas soli]KGI78470.1 hypothetical protein LF63_0103025 [Oleiagrimonas soli]MBB6184281.1 hypothetical protein [Oleiagrimonas soli]
MAILFLPGIKGSELVDTYPLDWPRRWSLEDMVIGDIIENPLDFALTEGRYDAHDGHWMRPSRLIHYAYGSIIDKLRAWQKPEPVYALSYDWRKPLELSAANLVRAMHEIAGREQAAGRSPELKFVTHSLGGLLLRSALALRNARDPFDGIGRVVFIAPPFRGAIGAPYALVVGEKDGWFGTDEDYRRIARTFPSVYQMTPSWAQAAVDENGRDVDLFDPANWQANVRDNSEFQPSFLRDAEAFIRGRRARQNGRSTAPMLSDAALARAADKVLVLCGAGLPTHHTLPVQTQNTRNPNWFDFAHAVADRHGDGRVHVLSAAIKGVTLAAFGDAGEHALLCRNERVTNLTSLWLEGKRALRMTRRGPQHSVDRAGRSYFEPWDGTPSSFDAHIA